ncbi:hypothetical protein RFI_19716, partial [Reticulomyxa filosa]
KKKKVYVYIRIHVCMFVENKQEGIVIMGMAQPGEVKLPKNNLTNVSPPRFETPLKVLQRDKEGTFFSNVDPSISSNTPLDCLDIDFEFRLKVENDRMLKELCSKIQTPRKSVIHNKKDIDKDK